MVKKIVVSIFALLIVVSLNIETTSAFWDVQHYKTSDISNYKSGCGNFRTVVLTIGRKWNSSNFNGTVQHRVFGTNEDVKTCYPNGSYITAVGSELFAYYDNKRTGTVGSYFPESSGGSSTTLSDAVFNWKDWTNVANLTVKVLANGFSTVISTSQPSGNTSSREIVASKTFGLGKEVYLPKNISTSNADKAIQDKGLGQLGFATEYNVNLEGEFSKVRSIAYVKYNVVDSWGDTVPLNGSHIRIEHYMW